MTRCSNILYQFFHLLYKGRRGEAQGKDYFGISRPRSVVDVIYEDIGIEKNPFHRFMIYAKRSSSAISFSVIDTMPRSFLKESGTCRAVMVFLEEETGCSFCMVSTKNATTANFSSRLILSMRSIYGPMGLDFTLNTFDVIIVIIDVRRQRYKKYCIEQNPSVS